MPNAGRNSHFQHFLWQKAIKARNLHQNSLKKGFFGVCTQTLVECFSPKKTAFSLKKNYFYPWKVVKTYEKLWIRTLKQHFGAKSKKPVFCKILQLFFYFFALFKQFSRKKCWKWLFWPAFGVPSTQTLFQIYNTLFWRNLSLKWIIRVILICWRKKKTG